MMQDMAMTKEEAKEMSGPCCTDDSGEGPKYPYGLELHLNDGSMSKLGITEMPAVGTTMLMQAQVTITGCRSSQKQGGDAEMNMDLQITNMELSLPGKTDAQRAAALYDK